MKEEKFFGRRRGQIQGAMNKEANMRQKLTTMYSNDHNKLDMENAGAARDRPLAEVLCQRRGFVALPTKGAAMQWLHRGLFYNHNFFKEVNMKKILSSMAIIGYTILNVAAANAYDGMITFNGRLTDTTCNVDVNGGGPFTGVVTLPTISASDLSTPGDTAGPTRFNIMLTNCTGSSSKVLAYFEDNPAFVNATTGNLKNLIADTSGGATNVELQLLDSAGALIKVGDDSQRDGAWAPIDTSGNATIQHTVRYYTPGGAGPGLVKGQVTFELEYL